MVEAQGASLAAQKPTSKGFLCGNHRKERRKGRLQRSESSEFSVSGFSTRKGYTLSPEPPRAQEQKEYVLNPKGRNPATKKGLKVQEVRV